MKAHRAFYPVATQCRVLGVSTSGYYAWLKRPISKRAAADVVLKERIAAIHTRSFGTYGAPRIHAELAFEGTRVGRKRVARFWPVHVLSFLVRLLAHRPVAISSSIATGRFGIRHID